MRRLVITMVAVAMVVSGCATGPLNVATRPIDLVEVGVDDAGTPTISAPSDLEVTSARSRTEWRGEGEILAFGDIAVLHLFAVSIATGEVVRSTWNPPEGEPALPQTVRFTPDDVGADLFAALNGKRAGARVVHLAPAQEGREELGPVAIVIDIVNPRASGPVEASPADMPIVEESDRGIPTITLRDVEAPDVLQVHTVIRGQGSQIRAGSWALLEYVAVDYSTGAVWQTSWNESTPPWEVQLGVGATIPGLDIGLLDQSEGSRVLLVVPPEDAYGETALVFVVDVIAVWNGEAA